MWGITRTPVDFGDGTPSPDPGFILLIDSDGEYLLDSDGEYLQDVE